MKNSRKLTGAICLLALGMAHFALALPLLAGSPAECCSATLCTTHQRKLPTPATPDCHSASGLGNCALQSCHTHEHHAIGLQAYLPAEPAAGTDETPVAFEPLSVALFFPSPAGDMDTPPPRVVLP